MLTSQEYSSIILDYAENQIKLKSTEKAIELYDMILKEIDETIFQNSQYIIAKICNRYFVCGRVGSYIQKFVQKWNKSMKIAKDNQYCDMCIENHFDKAHSLLLDVSNINNAIGHLKAGCTGYISHTPQRLKGQYLYRDIQLSFLTKEYKQLKNKIWEYEEIILSDKTIEFKLYFRIQFLIFKIIFCLMGKQSYTDIEMKDMLEQLNTFQAMQNKLQLYRCYYLSGKYYTKKRIWEKAILFYKKTFDNLNENNSTEEIQLQKAIIAEDMIVNFRKQKLPTKEFDLSWIDMVITDLNLKNILYYSEAEFNGFFSTYKSSAIISTDDPKEGYLLF